MIGDSGLGSRLRTGRPSDVARAMCLRDALSSTTGTHLHLALSPMCAMYRQPIASTVFTVFIVF